MIGVYKIENLINGKVYIGQSIDIETRWYRHKLNSKNVDRLLYRAFRKYGLENFSFEILQECDKKSLNNVELFYISSYCSNIRKNGYNLSIEGSHSTFKKLNNNILKEIIEDLKTKKLKKEICNKFNITIQYLNLINRGKSLKQNFENYPIRIETDLDLLKKENIKCLNCNELTNNIKFCSKKCSSEKQRKVSIRPSKKELLKLLKNSTYVEVGKIFNVSDNSIRKWIKNK